MYVADTVKDMERRDARHMETEDMHQVGEGGGRVHRKRVTRVHAPPGVPPPSEIFLQMARIRVL